MNTEKLYYEVVGSKGSDNGPYWWKIYHYDPTGNREIIVARSTNNFRSESGAKNDCCQWQEDNGVDAELA